MRHYIIASHKHLAEGFYTAVQAIVGEVANVHVISAYINDEDVAVQIESCLTKIPVEDEVIVMTDIYGGSVNNEFVKYLSKRDFHLIAGVNLALIISIMVEIQGEITRDKLVDKIEECKLSMRYCNDDLIDSVKEEEF